MRAVVFGAGGLLGRHLVEELGHRGVETVGFGHRDCPIEDREAVRAKADGAALLFNAAAFTDVDGAERDLERTFRVNAFGAEQVARVAAETGAVVVHVSTDFVFDGASDRPYDELDLPRPQSVYARSKHAGELLVAGAAPRHHVVRVQGLYGPGGGNFVSRLRDYLLAGPGKLRIDDERWVQPRSARAAARAIVSLATTDHFGTWHATCQGATTWHGCAVRMAERLGVAATWAAVPSAALGLAAARPANCELAGRRLAMCGLPLLPDWRTALDEYLSEAEADSKSHAPATIALASEVRR